MIVEKTTIIANRVKGDTWKLINDETQYKSLTDTLEAYFQLTKKHADFRLSPIEGKLYVIGEENVVISEKKYNIYGEQL